MSSMIQRKRWRLAAGSCCIVLLITSCTNLAAVHEWSNTSFDATQFNEIVTTYSKTPERLKRYDPGGDWDEQAIVRGKQAEALRKILSVVSDYMAALAILSADSTVDYNKEVDALTKGIGKLNVGFSKETVGAVGSVVKTVLGAAAKGYQARQVAKVVTQANEPLQVILRGELREIVDKDFRGDLKIEADWLDRYYDALLQKDGLSPEGIEELKRLLQNSNLSLATKEELKQLVARGNSSPVARTALTEWKELRVQENVARLKAVDAYVVVLDKVAEGHQKLYDSRNDLDAKTLIRELFSLVVELRKQIRILAES